MVRGEEGHAGGGVGLPETHRGRGSPPRSLWDAGGIPQDAAMGHGGRKIRQSQAGHEVEGILFAPPRTSGTIGGGGWSGHGVADAGLGEAAGCDRVRRGGRRGGGSSNRARCGSDGRVRAADKEEEGQGDRLHAEEVASLPTPLASSPQPCSLCGSGVGISPAGNRFWLLAGEDSDEEAGASSDYSGIMNDPSTYLHSPIKIDPGRIARGVKFFGKNSKPGADIPPRISSASRKCRVTITNVNNNVKCDQIQSGDGKSVDGEFVRNKMSEHQFSKIPDFWSDKRIDFGEMVVENCRVNTSNKKMEGKTGGR